MQCWHSRFFVHELSVVYCSWATFFRTKPPPMLSIECHRKNRWLCRQCACSPFVNVRLPILEWKIKEEIQGKLDIEIELQNYWLYLAKVFCCIFFQTASSARSLVIRSSSSSGLPAPRRGFSSANGFTILFWFFFWFSLFKLNDQNENLFNNNFCFTKRKKIDKNKANCLINLKLNEWIKGKTKRQRKFFLILKKTIRKTETFFKRKWEKTTNGHTIGVETANFELKNFTGTFTLTNWLWLWNFQRCKKKTHFKQNAI